VNDNGESMDAIRTITFDSYSTLVDVEAVEAALADRVDDPEPVSRHWRSRSLLYTVVTNELDQYDSFYALNRAALEHALAHHGIELPEAEREEILAAYHELAVFDDVREGLSRLNDAGYDTYVVSNGTPEMLASMVDHAGIEALVADTISADEIETYKPNVELYRHAAARTGTPIDAVAHVSALFYDVLGASHAGMTGVWIDRGKGPWDHFAGAPDHTVESIHDLADRLAAG
jgi:2-haloacid dehalogenase